MSDSEDFQPLKINEISKHGMEECNHGNQVAETNINNSTVSNNLSDSNVIKNDKFISLNTTEDKQMSIDTNQQLIEHDSLSNRKHNLDDEQIEKLNENEDSKDDENHHNDDLSKQKRLKRSRWGSEQDEDLFERQSSSRQTSDNDVDDDDDTIENSSSRHRERDYDRDYYRSSRQYDDGRNSEKSVENEISIPQEETVEFNKDDVVLDFYTADLNLNINSNCLSASNKSDDALCFLWAGVRATYGFKQGKICYEIRITEIVDCPQMPENEKEKFGIRLGWSDLSSGLQLGEFNNSFAFTSNGTKICKTNNLFTEETYGESFGLSDILTCYIDFDDNDENNLIRISFMKNGQDYGQAFELPKGNFNLFYPHILVKNVKFECNFGQLETPWSEIKSDYTFAQNIPLSDRTRCSEPIFEKNQCQVILLSGLNGSGKTTWANKYVDEHQEKNFYLLNIEHVLSKMTIDGKSLTIKDRNDGLMLRCNVCLQKLIEIAAQRRRNFIIDHVNTTRESQLKRQRLFTGFHRIGVVIIPDDDELKRRVEKLENNENISIPLQWIKEAKIKFYFPQKNSSLEEVIYPELSYDDAKMLYDKVRRDNDESRSTSRYDRHDDHRSSRNNNRNRYDDRDRHSRERDRYARSRSRERDRRTSRDNSRNSSSFRNDNYRGGFSRGGNNRQSDHRQDSRNTQRNNFNDGNTNNYRGRGGANFNNQSNDEWRGGYQQSQRNEYSNQRSRGGFQNRGSYNDNQRSGGFRPDFNNQQRRRQFNDYDDKQQKSGGRGFMQNNNYFGQQQQDRQNFNFSSSMQQKQQLPFSNLQQQQQQQRSQPFVQNSSFNQQQQFSSHLTQQPTTNATLSSQPQTSLNLNSLSNSVNLSQQNSINSWLSLCAAALNPQSIVTQQTQPDANSLAQQWAQWIKTAQMAQTGQQIQQQLTGQQSDSIQQQQSTQTQDANALYYQAYYAQLAAAQQQAAAAAAAAMAGTSISGVAPPNNNDK